MLLPHAAGRQANRACSRTEGAGGLGRWGCYTRHTPGASTLLSMPTGQERACTLPAIRTGHPCSREAFAVHVAPAAEAAEHQQLQVLAHRRRKEERKMKGRKTERQNELKTCARCQACAKGAGIPTRCPLARGVRSGERAARVCGNSGNRATHLSDHVFVADGARLVLGARAGAGETRACCTRKPVPSACRSQACRCRRLRVRRCVEPFMPPPTSSSSLRATCPAGALLAAARALAGSGGGRSGRAAQRRASSSSRSAWKPAQAQKPWCGEERSW